MPLGIGGSCARRAGDGKITAVVSAVQHELEAPPPTFALCHDDDDVILSPVVPTPKDGEAEAQMLRVVGVGRSALLTASAQNRSVAWIKAWKS